ncbi:MAG: methylenetetrahydrofolate reductase [Thermoplasmata archaeon]
MKYSIEITQDNIRKNYAGYLDLAEFITIPDNPFGKAGPASVPMAYLVGKKYNKRTVATINTRDRNRVGTISEILAALELDLYGIFVVAGDTLKRGREVREIDVYQLISLIKKYRQEYGSDILIGATLNPSRENELRIVRKKMESGADFFITQSIYDENIILNNRWIRHLSIPVYGGFMPLLSKRIISFYSKSFSISREMVEVFIRSSNLLEDNVALFKRIIKSTCDTFEGYHIMPMGNENFIERISRVIGIC